jgi:hypothetical protein
MLDCRSIALKVGEALKGRNSRVIAEEAERIFEFKPEHFPDPAVTTVTGAAIYDAILTLEKRVTDPRRRDALLIQFCVEIAPEKKKEEVREILFEGLPPEAARDLDRSMSASKLQRRIKLIWVWRRQVRRVRIFYISIPLMLLLVLVSVFAMASTQVGLALTLAVMIGGMLLWVAAAITYGNVPFSRDQQTDRYFPVETCKGKLRYVKTSYKAFPLDSEESILPVDLEDQLPGYTYRFRYVRDPRLLLSMTPADGQREEVLKSLAAGLAKAMGTRPGDLEANRGGRLSASQKAAILRRVLGRISLWFYIIALAIGTALQYLVTGWALNRVGAESQAVCSGLCTTINVFLCLVAIIRAIVPRQKRNSSVPLAGLSVIMADLLRGKVDSLDGPGIRRRGGDPLVAVGGMGFLVWPREHAAFCRGVHYRAYYLPLSRELVSLEPLDVHLPPPRPVVPPEEPPGSGLRL